MGLAHRGGVSERRSTGTRCCNRPTGVLLVIDQRSSSAGVKSCGTSIKSASGKAGHRIRLEIANSDSVIAASGRPHVTIKARATNTVHEGGSKPSRLVAPVIPR